MPIHMIDSQIYSGAWSTDEMGAIFDDGPRTQGWLDAIAALAEAQAEMGVIPAEVVPEIRRVCRVELLKMEALRQGYQETGHSTLGLIRGLKKLCSETAGEWIYYGATVQDITDTWMAMALLKVWLIIFRDLREIEANRPLKEAVLGNEQITAHLSLSEIESLFDYRQQWGLCPEFVDRVAALTQTDRETDEPFL